MSRPALILCLALCACAAAPHARTDLPLQLRPENAGVTGALEVHVTGIPSVQGQLYVELYDRTTYFDYQQVLNEQIVPVTGREQRVTLEHVPAGRYLAVASHDANGNDTLDTGLVRHPPRGLRLLPRGARALGPPEFEAGAFDFDGTRAVVEVDLR